MSYFVCTIICERCWRHQHKLFPSVQQECKVRAASRDWWWHCHTQSNLCSLQPAHQHSQPSPLIPFPLSDNKVMKCTETKRWPRLVLGATPRARPQQNWQERNSLSLLLVNCNFNSIHSLAVWHNCSEQIHCSYIIWKMGNYIVCNSLPEYEGYVDHLLEGRRRPAALSWWCPRTGARRRRRRCTRLSALARIPVS